MALSTGTRLGLCGACGIGEFYRAKVEEGLWTLLPLTELGGDLE